MQSENLKNEISCLQEQLTLLSKKFDDALERGVTLIHIKKIFRELKILQNQIIELSKDRMIDD